MIWLLFFEDGVSLFVGGDYAGEFLDVGVFIRGERDFANGVGTGVVEDVVFDGAGAFV